MSQTLDKERRELEDLRRQLTKEREDFKRTVQWEQARMDRERQLFEMKLRILEEELQKLAADKERFEQQRKFYEKVNAFESQEQQRGTNEGNIVRGEMFFIGVENKTSLKKRYKDLIKIYHPDNAAGDNSTIQEINHEYERLRVAMQA